MAEGIRNKIPSGVDMLSGQDGLVELATLEEADIVLIAIVGVAGLKPALAALEAGKDLAGASKEILVMAGHAVMETARRTGSKVLPVDSEHNAIFQCLEGKDPDTVSRLILTASGGPFREYGKNDLENVQLKMKPNNRCTKNCIRFRSFVFSLKFLGGNDNQFLFNTSMI